MFDPKAKAAGSHHQILCVDVPDNERTARLPAATDVFISDKHACLLPPLPPPQPLLHLSLCCLVLRSGIVVMQDLLHIALPSSVGLLQDLQSPHQQAHK